MTVPKVGITKSFSNDSAISTAKGKRIRNRRGYTPYFAAVLAVAIAQALTQVVNYQIDMALSPFLVFFGAITIGAWYGGFGPGVLATALSAIISAYQSNIGWEEILQLSVFVAEGVIFSAIVAALHSAKQRCEASLSKLQASQEQYRHIIQTTYEGIWTIDAELRTNYVNQRLAEMFGYSVEEMLGRPIFDFMDREACMEAQARIERRKQGIKEQFDCRYRRKDGSDLWAIVSTNAIFNEQGEFTGAIAMLTDVTERKQAEEALRTSEKRLRRLVESNIFGVAFFDSNGIMNYANDYFVKMVGYDREELLSGKVHWQQITPPEYLHLDAAATEELKKHGVCVPFQKEYIRKDGSRVPILIGSALLIEPQDCRDKKEQQIVCFYLDLSESKHTQEALQEANQTLQALIQACPVGISVFSLDDGTVKMWNPAAERIFGFSEQEVLGRFLPSVPEDKQSEFLKHLNAIRHGKTLIGVETRRQRKDGSSVEIGVSACPVRDAKGNVNCMSIVEDISDRKRLEQERAEQTQLITSLLEREKAARAEAEVLNRTKDEFLATLSHELRTPLNAMLGWTQLLRTRKFDESTTTKALEVIDRNTKSLAQLIDDVLDVSRIITGKLGLNLSPVELIPVIEAAVDTISPAADAKKIQIDCILNHSVGSVLGDTTRLQQVVWNLLSNAVKFTPPGGRVEVKLSLEESRSAGVLDSGGAGEQRSRGAGENFPITSPQSPVPSPQSPVTYYAQIRVSDTGQGISPDFLPYVFDRFRQGDGSTTRSFGGLGLGLAIVRHLVEMQGGTVCAESTGVGQGATFIVNLPMLETSWKAGNSGSKSAQEQERKISPLSLGGLRVLVVDDEPDARDLLRMMLGQYQAEVAAVGSAREAFEVLQQSKPDVLVSDIAMPEEDGYSLIRKVRALDPEQGGKIPAVALTAYARAEDRTKALLSGFQLHVPKPVNPSELAAVVAHLAGRINSRGAGEQGSRGAEEQG